MEQRKESYTSIRNRYGIRYLGSTISSQKVVKSLKKGVMTYIIYIAPSDISGYKVCPNDTYCKDLCLNSSGQRKLEMWSNKNTIGNARIKKAKMFYENRADFMALLIHEIEYYSEKAKKEGLDFAVRLNGTSDLSPIIFKHDGKSILDIFPNIQFYDYTKVIGRLNIPKRHPNYDLTYSFNGYNWEECK